VRFQKLAASIAALVKKYGKLIAAAGIYRIQAWLFDNPIWMAVELKWHMKGVLSMIVISLLFNIVLLISFRNKKNEWTLWTALDELSIKQSEFNSRYDKWTSKKTIWKLIPMVISYIPFKVAMLLMWCIKKSPILGDLAALIMLSVFEDPFVTTTYLRHGYVNGLRARDIVAFLLSSVISIGYWAVRNGLIVELGLRPLF
jgi:hypothetical protein